MVAHLFGIIREKRKQLQINRAFVASELETFHRRPRAVGAVKGEKERYGQWRGLFTWHYHKAISFDKPRQCENVGAFSLSEASNRLGGKIESVPLDFPER